MTVRDLTVVNDGVVLAVRDHGGSGSPIVLLHGATRTLVDLAPLARHLIGQHRVVAMDLRNHGRSGDGPWTWDAVLSDVRAVVLHFGFPWPTLVGHSLGGMVAALYLERYRDLTAAVNLDGHGTGRPEHYDMEPAVARRLLGRLEAMQSEALQAGLRPWGTEELEAIRAQQVSMTQARGLTEAAEAFDRSVTAHDDGTWSFRPGMAQTQQLLAAVEQLDLPDLYRRAPGPMLVYNAVRPEPSADDEIDALMAAQRRGLARVLSQLATASPHLEVETIDATHALVFEQPEQIADRIERLVRSAAGRPPVGSSLGSPQPARNATT